MRAVDLITFPAGALGGAPVRLPIVARGDGWLAVNKPAGIGVEVEPVEPGVPVLETALSQSIAAGKRQLADLGMIVAGMLHHLDAEATGALVLALTADVGARLRNDLGSGRWEFVFDVLAESNSRDEEHPVSCTLPLARHATEPRMIVSHATGRKCATSFVVAQSLGRWALWEARTREHRPNQVRVHAAESNLRVPGEYTYGRIPRIYLSQLKRRYRPGREDERPLHATLGLHLREVVMKGSAGDEVRIIAPRPKSFGVLLTRLEESERKF